MSNIMHRIFTNMATQANKALSSEFGRAAKTVINETAKETAVRLGVMAIEEAATQAEQGIRGLMADNPNGTPLANIPNRTTDELVNSLQFCPSPDATASAEEFQEFAINTNAGTEAMDELVRRVEANDSELARITEVMEQRTTETITDDNSLVNNLPVPVSQQLIANEPPLLNEDSLTDENRRTVSNRTLDGRRVSSEYGEFQYCRASSQLGSALNFLILWDQGQLDVSPTKMHANAGQSITLYGLGDVSQDNISYGQFVDMHCVRKFIALRRNLLRKVKAANVKCILDLVDPPIDGEDLVREILAGIDHSAVINEIDRTLNNQVGLRTNQQLCPATGGATGAIADRTGSSSSSSN